MLSTVPPTTVALSGKNAFRQFQVISFESSNVEFLPVVPAQDIGTTFTAVATTQNVAVADALALTGSTWEVAIADVHPIRSRGIPPSDQQAAVHTISTDYYQPYSAVTCVGMLIEGLNDSRPITLPITALENYESVPDDYDLNSPVAAIDYSSLTRSDLLNLPGSSTSYRVHWLALPRSLFNASALGVAIVYPPDSSAATNSSTGGDLTQRAVTCNLGAGWGSSSINATSYLESIIATSSLVNYNPSSNYSPPEPLPKGSPEEINIYQRITESPAFFLLPQFPERQIEIKAEWAEYLNPTIPSLNTSLIGYLLKKNGNSVYALQGTTNANSNIFAVEVMLSMLLANGLARVGYDFQLQGSPRTVPGPNATTELDGNYWIYNKGSFFTVDANESRDWVKLKVVSKIEGYAYNTRGSSPKIAIAVLLSYCCMALISTFYAGISGEYLAFNA